MKQSFVITIDGPAGAGKSTVAQKVARQLSFLYLDTGAIYRTIALAALQRELDLDNEVQLADLAQGIVKRDGLRLESGPSGQRVLLDGEDVSQAIRTPQVSQGASLVSVHPGVREALLDLQRAIAERGRVVVEGRDTGTVVFPDAQAKFFLTASVQERARRRYEQLRDAGQDASFEQLISQVTQRDRRDTERAAAPLRKAEDALEIDCSNKDADQVTRQIIAHVTPMLAR